MTKTVIIIPSRLGAQRLPNKPIEIINDKEMILHVYEAATESNAGEVYVATPDKEIFNIIKKFGGNAFLTIENHATGTDRIFEVFKKQLKNEPEIIINLQGDMPNIDPKAISYLVSHMKEKKCDIGTLASKLNLNHELQDSNIVKVQVEREFADNKFLKALDFFRFDDKNSQHLYHHVGIYAFTKKALMRYVSLKRSKLEIERKLEQLRALENSMSIHVGYIESSPLSVDTKEDLKKVKNLMKKNEQS